MSEVFYFLVTNLGDDSSGTALSWCVRAYDSENYRLLKLILKLTYIYLRLRTANDCHISASIVTVEFSLFNKALGVTSVCGPSAVPSNSISCVSKLRSYSLLQALQNNRSRKAPDIQAGMRHFKYRRQWKPSLVTTVVSSGSISHSQLVHARHRASIDTQQTSQLDGKPCKDHAKHLPQMTQRTQTMDVISL
ncbi:hypothetical protein PoB_005014400 [Plakobranchus ocellatus]|uniref:Uncharacterized protein n=1 Tax=Plakobranchus ocellatus TaxID=259542 RepID=A0AAV4BZ32_9GAST|nr:hypothetical protein PoB_005014400 [Plakobranchus ocellatus]